MSIGLGQKSTEDNKKGGHKKLNERKRNINKKNICVILLMHLVEKPFHFLGLHDLFQFLTE